MPLGEELQPRKPVRDECILRKLACSGGRAAPHSKSDLSPDLGTVAFREPP
jgi:hypothetical protein